MRDIHSINDAYLDWWDVGISFLLIAAIWAWVY